MTKFVTFVCHAAMTTSLLFMGVAGAALAQTEPTPPAPSPTIPRPPQTPAPVPPVPTPAPTPQKGENSGSESLTEKLDRGEGVIKPPPVGDPDIVQKPPDTNAKIKIIPPPGEPGGDPSLQPK